MPPNPADYDVSPEMIRERLKLNNDVIVIPTGVEHLFGKDIKNDLVQCYDKPALLLRTFPDFTLIKNNHTIFVEAKSKTTSIEAIGLYYNKLHDRAGARVYYSFPNITIPASLIPMEKIQIPLRHRNSFDLFLKDLFDKENCEFEYWDRDPPYGSGDPFVRIKEDDLVEFAEDVSWP